MVALETEFLDPELAKSTDLVCYWQNEIEYILESEDRLISWLESMHIILS